MDKKTFESLNTTNIASTEEWRNYYDEGIANKELWLKNTILLQDNRKHFKELFKKQDFCTSDSANRRLYVWSFDVPSGTIFAITAKERGTSYEITPGTSFNDVKLLFAIIKGDICI